MLIKNNKYLGSSGFTLVELLVAMLILTVGLLGLFETLSVALRRNVENELRQKAVQIAEDALNTAKAQPFSNTSCVSVAMGSGVFKNISVQTDVVDLAAAHSRTNQISVRVSWEYRGNYYEHQSVSAVASD